jgi:hypothetical protein
MFPMSDNASALPRAMLALAITVLVFALSFAAAMMAEQSWLQDTMVPDGTESSTLWEQP